jgi:formylglycine-generating enzyme required for sulfatase activity
MSQDWVVSASVLAPTSLAVAIVGAGRVTSQPEGIDCQRSAGGAVTGSCTTALTATNSRRLTATPAVGFQFTGWTGANCPGTGFCDATPVDALTVTATFAPLAPDPVITVAVGGTGSGAITSTPAGITCTSTAGVASGSCNASFAQGTTVTLTAQAAGGSTFTGWNGEGCSGTGSCVVQATQARQVTATFSVSPTPQYQLTVSLSGLGSGSVTSSPAGIACQLSSGTVSGSCAALFPSGTVVTLTTQLTGNSTLSGWSGACAGTGTCQVTMNGAQTVSGGLGLPPAPLGIGFGAAQWAYIPAGTFAMGSTTGELDEQPVRQVTISAPFLMQKTEVTQAQWRQVMGTNPSWFSGCGDLCPVENVSFDEVLQFLAALNAQSPGINYRLPTEAQWEYATRGGTTGDYSVFGGLTGFAWYGVNSGLGGPHPVAMLAPNPRGLYDVHGNVGEWVDDHYTPYTPGAQVDPRNVQTEGTMVIRGGSWFIHQYWLRSSARFSQPRQTKSYTAGFRLIRNP